MYARSFLTALLVAFAAAPSMATDKIPAPNPDRVKRASPTQVPAQQPRVDSVTVQGCFKSAGNLTKIGVLTWNSIGGCAEKTCLAQKYPVAGTMGANLCYCGDTYPPLDTLADDSKCNSPCTGYPDEEVCGGINYWTIYNTGITLLIENEPNITTTSSTSSSAVATSTDASGQQITVTASSEAQKSDEESAGSGTNTGGIVAGVVVGVVVAAAGIGGLFFWLRRKRNQEIEEDHRRNAAINSFVGGKPGSSNGSFTDARLDPVMAQRRMSNGSIDDNEDYSRKILRVTNA